MIEIIPALDIIEGRCVRLVQGDFARKTIYGNDPVDIALAFESAGVRRLHMVDLDGAKTGSITNLRVLERIADATGLVIDFGGGIKSESDVRSVLDAGAAMAVVGSAAVSDREEFLSWISDFGGERLLLGADVRDGKIAIDGWQTNTDLRIVPFLGEMREAGVGRAFVTDISKDGLMKGPSVGLYREILDAIPDFGLIASGGISGKDDIRVLHEAGVSGAIIGKAIYEGLVDPAELVRLSLSFQGEE
ncbi:MAG: 1-(5-phosphoribosyl)-5-[(5-phosphoribosylamino)methylideneamino]imidazole-4-carboxamide isomerase [Acidobacteriota bacterium]|nr:MAG: 1-(5-phosphoribosyl)-5-[(5-phosphoribosylamino)methylideneamino]imidazole-4-carboxamide isomerase [Acidobacteriota bacterium]